MNKNIIVIGPEDSGTNWFTWILKNHRDVNQAIHYSYPSHSGKDRHYLDLNSIPDDFIVLVVNREKWINKAGQMRVGYAYYEPLPSDPDEANKVILQQLETTNKKYFFASYETLIAWRSLYLKQLFSILGISLDYDYESVPYKDGNAKFGVQLLNSDVIDKANIHKKQESISDTTL